MRIFILALFLALCSCQKAVAPLDAATFKAIATAMDAKSKDVKVNESDADAYRKMVVAAFEDCGYDCSRSVCHWNFITESQTCTAAEQQIWHTLVFFGPMGKILPMNVERSPYGNSFSDCLKDGRLDLQAYFDTYYRPTLEHKGTKPEELSGALQAHAKKLVDSGVITQAQADKLKL
jgi:hypothetical protein